MFSANYLDLLLMILAFSFYEFALTKPMFFNLLKKLLDLHKLSFIVKLS